MALFDQVITSMGNKVHFLCEDVQRLKEGGDPEAVAAIEGQASEAQTLAENFQAELDETIHRWESIEKELGETQEELADLLRQLTDLQGKLAESSGKLGDSENQPRNTRIQVREMENELLELTQAKDNLRADLSR
ncbi:hypothetical protein BHE74_00037352 [Ensete ventricosum]|nr:hypothetical protein BHE74_00037352 [Ensete ventricosum]